MQWLSVDLQGTNTVSCHEMVLDESHMLGAMAENLHHLLTVSRPAWIRNKSSDQLTAACCTRGICGLRPDLTMVHLDLVDMCQAALLSSAKFAALHCSGGFDITSACTAALYFAVQQETARQTRNKEQHTQSIAALQIFHEVLSHVCQLLAGA